MKRWAVFFVLAVAAALALRLPELDRRPMHNDESVNAVKFGELWSNGEYRYDPTEHHGPTLHYITAAVCKLTGAPDYKHLSEVRLRVITAMAGVFLILLLLLARDALGRGAIAAAAIFTAVSPVMVFYSRYWIHEQLLMLFSFLALIAGWHFLKNKSWPWAVLTGLALGLMQATKETFVFVIAAAVASVLFNKLYSGATTEAGRASCPSGESSRSFAPKQVLIVGAVWFVVWATLFSSFFTNFQGLADSFLTFREWIGLAGRQSRHAHEWWFYFERLFWFRSGRGPVWSEGLLLILAIVGAVDGFRHARRGGGDAGFVCFLTLYTALLAGIYAFIPYKTPWCALGFVHGIILLAGVGAMALWNRCASAFSKSGVMLVLTLGTAHLGWQAWRSSFPMCADRANPWVYAQTSPDLLNLVETVRDVSGAGQGDATLINVISEQGDCWPLPWYLRQFDHVGWWEENPGDSAAPVVIGSAKLKLHLDAAGGYVMAGYYQLRPQVFLELYVERGLWERHLKR